MAPEALHERLAEAAHLRVRLTLGVEVAAALATAHREAGERVLEDLLEAEELEDGLVDRGVEAEAALVRADRRVELHAEPALHVELARIIVPRDTELEDALWLDDGLRDGDVLGVTLEDGLEGLDHLGRSLVELGLGRVAGLHGGEDLCAGVGHGLVVDSSGCPLMTWRCP